MATGTKYCFICTCMQSKKPRNGTNTTREAVFGRNLLEIVDDNGASCVYVVKEYAFKSSITKERARCVFQEINKCTLTRPTGCSHSAEFSFSRPTLISLKLSQSSNIMQDKANKWPTTRSEPRVYSNLPDPRIALLKERCGKLKDKLHQAAAAINTHDAHFPS